MPAEMPDRLDWQKKILRQRDYDVDFGAEWKWLNIFENFVRCNIMSISLENGNRTNMIIHRRYDTTMRLHKTDLSKSKLRRAKHRDDLCCTEHGNKHQ